MSKDNLMSDFGERKKNFPKIAEKTENNYGEQIKEEITKSKNLKNKNETLKNRKGWKHSWVTIKNIHLNNDLSIRDVVPGPFNSPRLVRATPFIVNSTKQQSRKEEKIRRGIPDAWAEYLATKGYSSEIDRKLIEKEVDMGYNNIRVTDVVWNKFGIPLTQGIPDPWKPTLIENDIYLEDEKAEICLCEPTFQKEEKIVKCRTPCEKFVKTIKHKSAKRENQKCCQNYEPHQILEEIPKNKKLSKCKETRNFGCNTDFLEKSESQNRICQSLQESNNIIQCEISGKITFHTQEGESFNGIGSLKLNCGQNGNDVREKQKEEIPGLYQNICNQFSKSSKIRHMITNFEPTKQFSKLKKALNGKKCDRIEADFGEEQKLVCYKCSCPYLKVLTEKTLVDNNLSQERIINNRSKVQNEKKRERKSSLMRCDTAECKKNEKQTEQHLEKILKKDKSIRNLKHVKVTADKKEKKDPNDKVQCGCKIQHTEDNTDSGNNADISQLSKCNDLYSRESAVPSVTSLTYMTHLREKPSKKLPSEFEDKKMKRTRKKHSLCSPCGKKPIRSHQRNIYDKDFTSDLADELSNHKSGIRKFKSMDPMKSDQIEHKRKLVSYASNVESETNFEKRSPISEHNYSKSRSSNKRRNQTSNSAQNYDKNSKHDDLVVENLSNNSNEKVLVTTEENNKSKECFQNECRKRGGGEEFDFWSSDSEPDKYEVRKNAWCEKKKSSVDSVLKIKSNPKEESDVELDNEISSKVFSSLLEESLDLISEPIGRKKTSEDSKISPERKSKHENKCYTKYCYDRSQKYNWDY